MPQPDQNPDPAAGRPESLCREPGDVAASRKRIEIKPLEPQPTYELIRPVVDKETGEVSAYCDGPQGIFVPKPGDRVPVREEWAVGDREPCDCLPNACTHYPEVQYRSDWGGIDDDVRWAAAHVMPDWAVRRWDIVKSVRVCQLDSVTDAEAMAAGYGNRQLDVWPLDDLYDKLKLTPDSWVSVVVYESQGAPQ